MLNNMAEIIKVAGVKSEVEDMVVSHFILNMCVQDSFLELGAGSGGWPLALELTGLLDDINWLLIEDFSWIDRGYNKERSPWPENKQQLAKRLESLYPAIKHEIFDTTVEQVISSDAFHESFNKLTGMRIDCTFSTELAEEYISLLTDDGLVFIDDNKVNCGIERIILGLDMVNRGILIPVWFGEKEAVYCKSKSKAKDIIENISKFVETLHDISLHANKQYFKSANATWDIITTRQNKLPATGEIK